MRTLDRFLASRPLQALTLILLAAIAVHFGLIDLHQAGAGGLLFVGLGDIGAGSAMAVNPTLTPIAIAYRNSTDDLIADQVLPEVPTGQKFKWTEYPIAQAYTVPETEVGRRDAPNMVEFTGTEHDDAVIGHALKDGVPEVDIKAWEDMPKPAGGGPINPMELSTMMTTDLILLRREINVAKLLTDVANYKYDHVTDLSAQGNKKWSDASSTPLDQILETLDRCLVRPNKLALTRPAFTALRKHPQIVQAVRGAAAYGSFKGGGNAFQTGGSISAQQLADLLELDKILIGASWVNTAKKGQPVAMSRTWGPHAAFVNVNAVGAQLGKPTFGFCAMWGGRQVFTNFDKDIGPEGGTEIRVVEYRKEVIVSKEAGALFRNVI